VTDLDQLNRYTVIFDQFQNVFLLYDEQGRFLGLKNIGDFISFSNFRILEILPSTGLLVKYDPSISLIYFGFALLMLTSSLSYLPYTQIWLFFDNKNFKTLWLGSATNRGKIQVQIDFENLIRYLEKALRNSSYFIL
jgi:cytochrome c biogenesis protein